MNQSQILDEILDRNKEIERIQGEINYLVIENSKLPESEKDKDYTESINSYQVNN